MNPNQPMNTTPPGARPEDLPEDGTPGMQPRELDSAIIEGQPRPDAPAHSPEDVLARVQVGAEVFAADGAEVAVVEMVGPGHVGVRAGQPGRTIDLPGAAVARVSPDGQRVEIALTEAQIEQFVGAGSTGADHLAGQQGDSHM